MRLIVVGLDGATFDVIRPLVARGELPVLGGLLERGLSAELLSTQPPATLPAWTSFLTGASPDQHGVTDLFVHPPGSYALVPATGRLRRLPTFVARLAALGKRVISLGVPGTFPPEATDSGGLTVSGFDAPGAREAGPEAVWPRQAFARVQALGGWRYATFNEQRGGPAQVRRALAALLADLDKKQALVTALAAEEPWDVFCVHLQATDTAGHHLWHTFDERSPRHLAGLADAVPSVYRRADALIGAVLATAPDARVMVVSDHGMGGASDVAVYLNRYLAQRGLLRFRRGGAARRLMSATARRTLGLLPAAGVGMLKDLVPESWRGDALGILRAQGVDFAESYAFSDELDYAPAIWLNRRGVFPEGRASERAARVLIDKLARELVRDLVHPSTGEPLLTAVHRRDELYAGPMVAQFPDLLLEPAWPGGFRPSFLLASGPGEPVVRLSPEQYSAPRGFGMPGVHRREGVFIAAGEGIPAGALPAFDLAQAGSLVYALLGLAPPSETVSLPPELAQVAARLITQRSKTSPHLPARPQPKAYDAAAHAALTSRLQALGYL